MNKSKKKILVIGLDGATFNILNPLMEKGLMPNLKKIKEKGSWGELESTIPPITGPSWTSFATGKNPGKTGVFDFMIKKNGSYELKPITSKYLKGQSIWDYLTKENKKSIILNYPTLFPAYKINGIMVSGIGGYKCDNFTYPKDINDLLDELTGGYEIETEFLDKKYSNKEDLYLKDSHRAFDKKIKVAKYFLKKEDWDFFMVVFCETDFLQHFLWKHIDSSHPLFDPQISPRYKKKFEKYYQDIDKAIGNLQTMIDDNTNIFIVSDHGFGPSNLCFNPNLWLESKGYLKRKRLPWSLTAKNKVSSAIKIILGERMREYLSKKVSQENKKLLKVSFLSKIDLEKTKALALEHTGPLGAIYIVDKLSVEEKKTIKKRLIKDLKQLPQEYGQDLKVNIYDPEKIYWGDKTEQTPDIIFTIANWNCLMKNANFAGPIFKEEPCNPAITGSHRPEGILMAVGPDIRPGFNIKKARIFDVSPTCLYLLNSPISQGLDGKVLKEMIKKEKSLKNKPIKTEEKAEKEAESSSEIEEEKIKEKLKGLGYL